MRRLTDNDLANIAGTVINDYHVENVRGKRGSCTDSDHYGIALGRNQQGHYVTWQFHLLEDETVSVYWGHYFMENRGAAIQNRLFPTIGKPVSTSLMLIILSVLNLKLFQ